jgi:hypothetical protein
MVKVWTIFGGTTTISPCYGQECPCFSSYLLLKWDVILWHIPFYYLYLFWYLRLCFSLNTHDPLPPKLWYYDHKRCDVFSLNFIFLLIYSIWASFCLKPHCISYRWGSLWQWVNLVTLQRLVWGLIRQWNHFEQVKFLLWGNSCLLIVWFSPARVPLLTNDNA